MGIANDIKDMLSVSRKQRHDALTDQFSRVFMLKICMVATLFVGMNWYKDDITCVIHGTNGIDGGFVKQACWINGLYIFEQVETHQDDIGYYGIPREIQNDGITKEGSMCQTSEKQSGTRNIGCDPMKKTFFLQYQYMVFFVSLLAVLYYSPYLIWKVANTDIISLKGDVAAGDAEKIVESYFNETINPSAKMRYKVLANLFVKLLYIIVNVCGFILTDGVFNGRFRNYGNQWVSWSKLDNEEAYNYMGGRDKPKPGNTLLPSFALCEVHESAIDIKHEVLNKHKFVCEMSGHVLYQYMLLIMWFCMVAGILVSCVGFVIQIVDHILTISCFLRQGTAARKMYKRVTIRECEYLEFIRRKNLSLYGEVIRLLKEDRFGQVPNTVNNPSAPLYPTKEDMMLNEAAL